MRISDLGPWAPFWFIIIYIIACLTFFPGFILTMGAGILFGVAKGTLYVSIGATIGAAFAFLIRGSGRSMVVFMEKCYRFPAFPSNWEFVYGEGVCNPFA